MTIKTLFAAAVVAAGTLLGTASSAAVLSFDLSTNSPISGGFEYDSDTGVFSNVNVVAGATYTDAPTIPPLSGGGFSTTLDFQSGTSLLSLVLFTDITMPGLAVGQSASFSFLGNETIRGLSNGFSDATGTVTRLDDPVIGGEVPLPASFPLMLAGLGALAWVRRKD